MEWSRLCLVPGILLAGCNITADMDQTSAIQVMQSPGNWRMRQDVGRISGRLVTIAELRSSSARQQSRKKSYVAQISILCEGGGPAVYVTFEGSVSSRAKADFAYRVDNNPGQVLKADTSSDRKSVVLRQDKDAPEFLRQLGSSAVLFARIDSPGTGISDAEFATAGAAAAIETALSECRPSERTIGDRQKERAQGQKS